MLGFIIVRVCVLFYLSLWPMIVFVISPYKCIVVNDIYISFSFDLVQISLAIELIFFMLLKKHLMTKDKHIWKSSKLKSNSYIMSPIIKTNQ